MMHYNEQKQVTLRITVWLPGLSYLIVSIKVFHHLKSFRAGLWQDDARAQNTEKGEIRQYYTTINDKGPDTERLMIAAHELDSNLT